jgi:pimeloyl-ACP methyl ester carboxylesterase
MQRRCLPLLILLLVFLTSAANSQTTTLAQLSAAGVTNEGAVKYGSNPAAGNTFTHGGIHLYYEIYGAGEPLLLVHGNGGSIADFKAQIDYFRKRYEVIAMDSRDQGRSGDSPDVLTYEVMTDDLAALIDHLKCGPVNVLGWSDGAIEALLLGIRHPENVKKIAAMAANLNPNGIHPAIHAWVESNLRSMSAADRETPQGKREVKLMELMLHEPQIDPKTLESIKVPTLVLAGDRDAIVDEHTLEIYHHIPNSELSIFPNATHMIPFDDPALFDLAVDHFFQTPFVAKDRLNDLLKSYEALLAAQK